MLQLTKKFIQQLEEKDSVNFDLQNSYLSIILKLGDFVDATKCLSYFFQKPNETTRLSALPIIQKFTAPL